MSHYNSIEEFQKNLLENVVKKNAQALQATALNLHQIGVRQNSIPKDTGFLREKSKKIQVISHNTVSLEYTAPYSGYVWEKNKTGRPKWTLYTWNNNSVRLGKVYLYTLLKAAPNEFIDVRAVGSMELKKIYKMSGIKGVKA